MRKLAIAAICAALALALTGCGNTTVKGEQKDLNSTRIVCEYGGVYTNVLTDTETGVQYIIVSLHSYGTAITPLLNADGTPYVEVE